jgi:hypothetical protein
MKHFDFQGALCVLLPPIIFKTQSILLLSSVQESRKNLSSQKNNTEMILSVLRCQIWCFQIFLDPNINY